MTTPRRPRLALPFTILTEPDTVRLVAGEDFRYTLQGEGIHRWLGAFLGSLDGRRSLDEAVAPLPEADRDSALKIVQSLYGERVMVDGPAAAAHAPARYALRPEGSGPLASALLPSDGPRDLRILCQDRLDYEEALAFNRRGLAGTGPWMWVTTGPMSRGFVSPPFLPDAGPCLGCLVRQFRRLSPAPEIYDALAEYARKGCRIEPVPFPEPGLAILRAIVLWKAAALAEDPPPAALFRLHVLEASTFEVSTHRVYPDPECPDCR